MLHHTARKPALSRPPLSGKLAGGVEISWRNFSGRCIHQGMTYLFGEFELDPARFELRSNGVAIAIEPQVFSLLKCLVENRDRVLTRDELIARVWERRVISDAAVASRIKSARQALGDDGRAQRFIRTIHGQGFRFVADVTQASASRSASAAATVVAVTEPHAHDHGEDRIASRPGIAVLPFRLLGDAGRYQVIAEALPQDLITELSRLHWLLVIARASSFRFQSVGANLDDVRRSLNVRYCLSGTVEVLNQQISVTVELSDTLDKNIIWSERFTATIDATYEVREQIVRAVISALEFRIPLAEARRAQLKSPDNLDAWSAFHLGLHHMYRFNKTDNAAATEYFRRAISMDPEFARAYAGLSFTHFQDAFLRYSDPDEAARLARHYAEKCLERDPAEPFGNLAMGRSHWLRDDLEGSLAWLDRASTLNPNYAQAVYSRGWTESLLGNAPVSLRHIATAEALSPLDPLLYGMFGVRALSNILTGDFPAAATWATRAARTPGAHALIDMIAVAASTLNGDDPAAKAWAELVRKRAPDFTTQHFLRAFPFRDPQARVLVVGALRKFGF